MPEAAEFDDISLEIRSLGKGRFETRLQAEGQVGAAEPFAMQVDAAKLKPFLTVFNAVPAGLAPDPRAIGSSLFEALFQGDVRRLFDRCRARADEAGADGSARGVRLRIQLDLRDEQVRPLAALPWELLHDPLDRTFYGHGRERLLVRHLDSARPVEPLPLTHPLRILVVPSSPKDLPKLNLKKEVERLEAAVHRDRFVHVTVQKPATIEAVRQRLREEPFHALHFLGHGGFKAETGLGWLCFETADGKTQGVDGDFFSDLVREFPSLRLVVLNACRTAQVPGTTEIAPYATLGTALSLAGVPAVVAMQFTVSDSGAIRFSETFYQSLAAGDPVDVAVAVARRELYESEHPSLEWAVPVLFLRSRDGRIFDLPREAEGTVPKAKIHPRHGNGDPSGKSAKPIQARKEPTKEPWMLGIRSREPLGERPETALNLTRHFDGRLARHPDLWRTDILPELEEFLRPVLTSGRPILLDFAAHASLAFAAGYVLEAKSGLDITLRQRLQKGGFEDWTPSRGPLPDAPYWKAEDDRPRDAAAHDVAVAVGLTWPVLDDVETYLGNSLEKSHLAVSRLLPATLAPEPSPSGVHGGAHALALAQALALRIRARTVHERHGTLHLFVSGPNAFLFYLGQLARGLGRIQLYEYDFDSGAPGAYRPSIVLPAEGT